MTHRTARRVAVLLALGPLVLLGAPQADSASTTVGEAFVPPTLCSYDTTLLQVQSTGGKWAVPTDGVITSFRFEPGTVSGEVAASVAFKLARRTNPTTATIVSTTPQVPVTAGVTTNAAVRMPARAGDVIGLSIGTGPDARCARVVGLSNGTGQEIYVDDGDAAPGATLTSADRGGIELDVEATFEPDADGDGFGDVTQDTCPTQATTQGTCAPTPPSVVRDTVAPETAIASLRAAKAKRKPNGKPRRAALTATFSASEAGRTTCSLDGAAPAPCTSPYVAKVTVGSHRLAVVATDAAGNVDATPATATVVVKAAKKKGQRK